MTTMGLCRSALVAGLVFVVGVMFSVAEESTAANVSMSTMAPGDTTQMMSTQASGATSVTTGLLALLLPVILARLL